MSRDFKHPKKASKLIEKKIVKKKMTSKLAAHHRGGN